MVTWGFVLAWLQHFPEAIAIFKFDTDAAYIYDNLADAYAKNGQKDLAIASYEKSLTIKPDNPSTKAELGKTEESSKREALTSCFRS